jgi:hypothetical protein
VPDDRTGGSIERSENAAVLPVRRVAIPANHWWEW